MNWKNWAGNVTASPSKLRVADCESDLVDVVAEARNNKQKVRAVGTGHSFAAICATDDILVSLVDREACRVSDEKVAAFWAGTKIGSVAAALWEQGCSFENQGDIDVQSLAGALSTGTHGTGNQFGSFSAKAKSLRLVTANGDVRVIDEQEPDLLRATAVSVGMLGLISEASLQVLPRYHLREETAIVEVNDCFDTFESYSEAHRNTEFYWLPRFDKCIIKTIDVTDETLIEDDTVELPPPGTIERYLRPLRANKAYLVYRNIRTVPFLEMEYSVPIEAGMACMRDIRQLIQTRFPEMSWVTEYRTQAADNLMGKLCFLSPSQRTDLFPEFEAFSRIRRQLDPDGLFLNDFLRPFFS